MLYVTPPRSSILVASGPSMYYFPKSPPISGYLSLPPETQGRASLTVFIMGFSSGLTPIQVVGNAFLGTCRIPLKPPWALVSKRGVRAVFTSIVRFVGSRTRDRVKAGPGLVRKVADLTTFNQSKGKSGSYAHAARVGIEDPKIINQSKGNSGSYAHAARVGMQNHSKGKSLLHLNSLK
jgi:hypothetical protein